MAFKDAETFIVESDIELHIAPGMANRHGLISGTKRTGETVTLQVLAQSFSLHGVQVFMTDIKVDLCGVSKSGVQNLRIPDRTEKPGLHGYDNHAIMVCFRDLFGEQDHPMRTTMNETGPLLLSRLLNLSDPRKCVLNLEFKIADGSDLLIPDLKDLKLLLGFVGNNLAEITFSYGNISAASIGSIQRNIPLQYQLAAAWFCLRRKPEKAVPFFRIRDPYVLILLN